ncbi:MAG TPA: TadE/TadG family type IV pilus assembly protein [Candidatus Dormibacteraeota bacterium]|nr:TadE/TadG family type IV pilus assembly protein [Candidatus Dormibacteraeota bacterium]
MGAFSPRSRQVGQSIVELAIATPVLIFMLFGLFNAGVMIADKVIAGSACRQGARLAAEIGGQLTNPTLTTDQVDQDVVRNVLAVASAMNYSSLATITIYAPTNPNGDFNAATDLYNQYSAADVKLHQSFLLTNRNQTPPNETSIGVRLDWSYTPPTGFQSFTIALNEHAVYKASPVLV